MNGTAQMRLSDAALVATVLEAVFDVSGDAHALCRELQLFAAHSWRD